VSAQSKITKNISLNSAQEVFLNLKYASEIQVQYWDKNEVGLTAEVDINNNQNNDKFDLEISTEKSQLKIESLVKDLKDIAKTQANISDNKNQNFYYSNNHGYWDNDNKVFITSGKQVMIDIDYQIFIPKNISLKIKTIAGNIKTDYDRGKLFVESISGNIDIKIAESEKKTLELKTISGEVYSNIQLAYPQEKDEDGLPLIGGGYAREVLAKMNGGGEKISLKSISGNIYIRKK
jgi:hypothetical protein